MFPQEFSGPYPSEMYKGSEYRAVHGMEEERQFARLGWSKEKDPEVKEYAVHTAKLNPPKRSPAQEKAQHEANAIANAKSKLKK